MTFPVFIKASKTRVSIAKEIKEVNRLRLQFERSMTSRLMLVFKRTGKSASAEYMRSGDINQSLIPLENDLRKVFETSYRAVIEKFADRVYTNRKADRFSQLVFDYTFMNAGAKITGIAETTGKLINKAILDGEKEGLGASKIGKLIQERTSGSIGRSRAVTIARTETHAAASFATDTATRELALPAQRKRWVSVSDARTRTGHSAANGQEVGIDEKFLVPYKGATVEMSYPHDGSGGAGNNINCRCLAIYFTDEDALFDDATPVAVKPVIPKPVIPVGTDNKPIIDLTDIITLAPKSDVTKLQMMDVLNEQLTPQTARIVDNLPKPSRVLNGRGVYYSSTEILQTGLERKTFSHEYGHHIDAVIHKDKASFSYAEPFWSTVGLRDAVIKDSASLGFKNKMKLVDKAALLDKLKDQLYVTKTKTIQVRKRDWDTGEMTMIDKEITVQELAFEGAEGLSDIIDGFSKGLFYKNHGAFGHGVNYWKKRRYGVMSEAFANLFSIQTAPTAMKWAKKNLPELTKAFNAKLKELDNGN